MTTVSQRRRRLRRLRHRATSASAAILQAARLLLPDLERGRRIDAGVLRAAMETAFGASDAAGAWDWKTAYDACEAATVLFLRKYGKGAFPQSRRLRPHDCRMLTKIAGLLPTHTRRSEESQALQQFSTPITLGLAACTAAAITSADCVLEPSAGTGLLAILAEIAGGALVLNELAETRAALLAHLFPGVTVTRFDAAQIDDHLDAAIAPSVVLMNPPFSAMANVDRRMADAAYRHVASALARLTDGGRLVAITGANFGPEMPAWRDAFIRLQERGRVVFTAAIDGAVYAKHGTTIETRLTVIDRVPARRPDAVSAIARDRARRGDAARLDRAARAATMPDRDDARTVPAELCHAANAFAAISRARHRGQQRSAIAIRKASSSPTRQSTGRRPKAAGSRMRFMKNTSFSRSAFPALRRIRPSWCSPRRWRRSRRQNPPIGRISRQISSPMACCPTRSSRASSMPARPMPISSPGRGRSMRPSTSSPPRATTPRTPSAFAAAGFSATAPAPARAARSPASCSTTG